MFVGMGAARVRDLFKQAKEKAPCIVFIDEIGEAGVPFFSISGSEFIEMFVGMGAARVRDLFKQAKEKAPCIVFIDEIDAIGKKRDGANGMGGNDEREQTLNQLLSEMEEQTLNQLLSEMDGFDGGVGVVILAATNRPESLDKALLRPGRFDRRVPVELPDLNGREAILKVHAKAVKYDENIDFNEIARATSGASGGFDGGVGVVILAATNRPESLDKALLRPGRFDRRVPVELPDLNGREAILKVHAKAVKYDANIDFNEIARATSGASGAELANIVNEAALRAVRDGRKQVEQMDLEEAVETIIAGYQRKGAVISPKELRAVRDGRKQVEQMDLEEAVETIIAGYQRKGAVISPKEKKIIAYHEIGHALVAAINKHSAPVHKITIIPRTSGALGYTMQVEEGEKVLMSKEEAIDKITTFTGGRAAEEIIFNMCGHALVAAINKHSAPVHKITIIPRTSGALGYTMQVEEGEKVLMSKEEAIDKITTFTGGRAAEEIIFNMCTSGASNDIEQATRIARAMITRFGMSEEFGMHQMI